MTSATLSSTATNDSRSRNSACHEVMRTEWNEPIRFVASDEFAAVIEAELEQTAEWLRKRRNRMGKRTNVRRTAFRLPATIVQLCESPLLAAEEETQLFKSMNYLKYQAELLRESLEGKATDAKAIARIDQLLAAACEIRNAIVEANTRLVVSVVKDFADDANPFEDLVSEGITAVLRATETFDYSRGFRFSTYATRSIRSAIYRKVMQDRKRRERFRSGDVEAAGELAEETSAEELSPAQYRGLKSVIAKLLDSLDERERYILEARFQFSGKGKRPPFRLLAERLGVSKERVRQLEVKALTKLRELSGQIPNDILAASL